MKNEFKFLIIMLVLLSSFQVKADDFNDLNNSNVSHSFASINQATMKNGLKEILKKFELKGNEGSGVGNGIVETPIQKEKNNVLRNILKIFNGLDRDTKGLLINDAMSEGLFDDIDIDQLIEELKSFKIS
jgi:hypothetical protein